MRNIVVTGASSGLGKAITQYCVRRGDHVILADIAVEQGEALAHQINASGGSARFCLVDLGNPKSIERLSYEVSQQEGKIHGLVNNAAIASGLGGTRFEDIDIDVWDRVMQVNVRGTWLISRAFSPLLKDNIGRIVNIASDTALWGQSHLLAYVASKGAVIAMTKSLSRELGLRRIGVIGLAPGLMRNAATEAVPEERHKEYELRRAIPGPQVPEDVVETVHFCLSAGALALTGQIIPTNAGSYCH